MNKFSSSETFLKLFWNENFQWKNRAYINIIITQEANVCSVYLDPLIPVSCKLEYS